MYSIPLPDIGRKDVKVELRKATTLGCETSINLLGGFCCVGFFL